MQIKSQKVRTLVVFSTMRIHVHIMQTMQYVGECKQQEGLYPDTFHEGIDAFNTVYSKISLRLLSLIYTYTNTERK